MSQIAPAKPVGDASGSASLTVPEPSSGLLKKNETSKEPPLALPHRQPDQSIMTLLSEERTAEASPLRSHSSLVGESPVSGKGSATQSPTDSNVLVRTHEQDASSSALAFFSDRKISAMSRRLGHDRVRGLIDRIETDIRAYITAPVKSIPSTEDTAGGMKAISLSAQSRTRYIKSFFENVHPIYPFLSRDSFEAKAFSANLTHLLSTDKAWCALYHAVLSIGSLYHGCGAYAPFQGQAWAIFRISLSVFPHVVFQQGSLTAVQAVLAMTLFSLTIGGLPLQYVLVPEAVKMALTLRLNRQTAASSLGEEAQRTFWVIYYLEADFNYSEGVSTKIPDCDISCPIPKVSLPSIPDIDWLSFASKYAYTVSSIYRNLFSARAEQSAIEVKQVALLEAFQEIEQWRLSAPEVIRPGTPIRPHRLKSEVLILIALHIHYLYHNTNIVLSRLCLLLWPDDSEKQADCKMDLTRSARDVVDLTHLIPIAPYVSPWVSFQMPQSALFALFDFVIENPSHPETKKNLAYLKLLEAFFVRMGNATGNSLYGSISGDFVEIANTLVSEVEQRTEPRDKEAVVGQADKAGNEGDERADTDMMGNLSLEASGDLFNIPLWSLPGESLDLDMDMLFPGFDAAPFCDDEAPTFQ